MNISSRRDDLTKIKGIGAIRQRWLGESLQIFSYADLAATPIEVIVDQLKAERKLVSRAKIESWISEAKALAAVSAAVTAATLPMPETAVWKPAASFVVEFQEQLVAGRVAAQRTAVHHVEADVGQSWPTVEQAAICEWMIEQADLSALEEPIETPELSENGVEIFATTDLAATKLFVLQEDEQLTQLDVGVDKRPFLGVVTHKKPLDLEILLEPTSVSNEPQKLLAQCQFSNRLTGAVQRLGMQATAVLGESLSYSARIADVLLEPGVYDLGILVSGQPAIAARYFDLPKLTVV